MIIVMHQDATRQDIDNVESRLSELGFKTHPIFGDARTVIGAIGDKRVFNASSILTMPGVEKIVPIMRPYKLVGRELKQIDTIIDIDGEKIGGGHIALIAGPCAVENAQVLMEVAERVKEAGAAFLRGGAYKPRTSPYSFQGLEKDGLKMLKDAKEQTGLKIVTEVIDTRDVEVVGSYCDVIQIGARNMQNFRLLQEAGHFGKPIILKRGISATIDEWLMAAEYILDTGNKNVILCERGIRTYENATRFTLDISAVAVVKENSHLPVIIDPSHAAGNWKYVSSLAKASVAAGADGLIIEVHPDPSCALSDGQQSLRPVKFNQLIDELKPVAAAVGKTI